jgi:hypothetical protein
MVAWETLIGKSAVETHLLSAGCMCQHPWQPSVAVRHQGADQVDSVDSVDSLAVPVPHSFAGSVLVMGCCSSCQPFAQVLALYRMTHGACMFDGNASAIDQRMSSENPPSVNPRHVLK